jgi:hypothetical protein
MFIIIIMHGGECWGALLDKRVDALLLTDAEVNSR